MRLRELLEFKLYLEGIAGTVPVVRYLESVKNECYSANSLSLMVQDQSFIKDTVEKINHSIEAVKSAIDPISERATDVEKRIDQLAEAIFRRNDLDMLWGSPSELKRQRHIPVDPNIEEELKKRIWLATSWQWPCLDIGSRDGHWTQYMTASDLIYVADLLPEFLTLTSQNLKPDFINKLKKYVIYGHDLAMLPQHQFGFVFSWGHLHFCHHLTVKRYLEQVKNLLLPGGRFLFTYNNADTLLGMEFAERHTRAFTPRRYILNWAKELEYEVSAEDPGMSEVAWIELKAPGRLTTVKYHPVRAEINRRST